MLQGLGVQGFQESRVLPSPIPCWSTEILAAQPAVTQQSPGDNLWVLLRVGDAGLDHPADFSSSEVKGVWLRKLRVDKGAVLLPPSDVTHAVQVLCPPWGDPADLSHPTVLSTTCRGAEAWERLTVPARG